MGATSGRTALLIALVGGVATTAAVFLGLIAAFAIDVDCRGGFIDIDPAAIPDPDSTAGRLCSVRGPFWALPFLAGGVALCGTIRATRARRGAVLGGALSASAALLTVGFAAHLITAQGTDGGLVALSFCLLVLAAGSAVLLRGVGREAIGYASWALVALGVLTFLPSLGGIYSLMAIAVGGLLLGVRRASQTR